VSEPGAAELEAAQLRAVLDSIPARIALIDRARRHRYVNQEYAAFLGRPVDRILGRTVAQMIGAEAYARIRHLGERALAGETARWEGWLPYRGEPGPRFVQRVYIPYRAEGRIEGYFSFSRDLTELKRGEQRLAEQLAALQASEALGAAVIATALDCVIVIDEAGTVVEFNPAAERTFGYARADAIGRPIAELIVPPALRGAHAAGLRRYLETGEAHVLGRRVEIEAMRSDGGTFPAELAITEVRLPERRLFTAYLRDLTPARRARAEIERQRQALHQSEKLAALGSLLAGVAHELNNPLSIVISNAQMLQEEAEDAAAPALGERAGRMRAAAERCASIVRTFLAIARQGKVRVQSLALGELVASVLGLLQHGLQASGIEVICDVPSDLPPVQGDPDQLHQVLINLVMNAKQALEGQSSPRRIIITVHGTGKAVEVMVADNGPGVAEEIRSRLFDPFFTTKPTGTGSGVGLAVSRGIVEAHGGSLRFVQPAVGAQFVIRLPLAAGHAAPTGAPSAGVPSPAGAESRSALTLDS
jgi:PAS domain S-box-containing protein